MGLRRVGLLLLVAGAAALTACGSPEDHADPSSTPSGSETAAVDARELLGHARVLVGWEGLVQTTDAATWLLSPVVTGGIPSGEQLHGEWSPDGTTVVFAFDPGDGTRDIWTADMATGDARVLVDCTSPCVWTDQPSFSPDGSTVAFIQGDEAPNGDGVGTLQTVSLTGGDPTLVYTSGAATYPMAVAWSPDGSAWAVEIDRFASAAVAEGRVTGMAVGIVDAAGALTLLTDDSSKFGFPDWSPDGTTILMSSADELWTVTASGGDPVQLTHLGDDGGVAKLGAYSADGRAIVFNVEQPAGGTPTVAVMPAAGGAFVTLGQGTHPQPQP